MAGKKLLGLLAAASAAVITLSACGGSGGSSGSSEALGVQLPELKDFKGPSNPVLPAGNGQATCSPDTSIALVAVLSGSYANLGQVEKNAVELALQQHNSANPNCQVKLKVFDTEGSPDKAAGVVTQVINEKSIIGVVGPGFSGTMQATGALFSSAGLAQITFASRPSLSTNGWKTFFRGIANDDVQGPAAANFMLNELKASKVFVINDDASYGRGVGEIVKKTLGAHLAGSDQIIAGGSKDFSSTVSKVLSSGADAVFYGGYYAEAAPLFKQLRDRGYKGILMGPDGIKDDQLIKLAANAAQNVYMSCACVDGTLIKSFNEAYQQDFKSAPGTFSADAYDMTTVLLTGIDKGENTREKMLTWVKNYDANGIAKHYKWNDHGELNNPEIFFYRVKDSKIIPVR